MMRSILNVLIEFLPAPRVILDREGKRPYLSRFYLKGAPHMADGSSAIDEFGNPKREAIFPKGLGIYLHRFHQSDASGALHNHPWKWAYALILAGGYWEERRFDNDVRTVARLPGDLVRISEENFHRVDLVEDDSWSLFIAGPKGESWGFWDRYTHQTTPWREFLARGRS
jgi:hypothetical protein